MSNIRRKESKATLVKIVFCKLSFWFLISVGSHLRAQCPLHKLMFGTSNQILRKNRYENILLFLGVL